MTHARADDTTIDTQALRKARGAFFTPPEMSGFVVDWAVRAPTDLVLEPSCGEASFLLAAGERLSVLGASSTTVAHALHGVELHAASARAARALLAGRGFAAAVLTADFFDVDPSPQYDAVVGNPPYVRYHQFTGSVRAKALEAALTQGVRLNGLASSWAAFTVHAARFLKPGGRLGLVLPAELLTVKYAASVRRFFLERFASVRLVLFERLVFPGVLEEVVLLLAEGVGPAPHFEVFQARDLADLKRLSATAWTGFAPDDEGKWLPALLHDDGLRAFQALTGGETFGSLGDWGSAYLGSVTGNNDFFTLSEAEAAAAGLDERELRRISPPGSKHLIGLTFNGSSWRRLVRDRQKCFLFYPDPFDPSRAARAYVRRGEEAGVHLAYKCRHRTPWWRVPLVREPDLLLTYMAHDRPRLVSNVASVRHLNSVYGVTLREPFRAAGKDVLPLGAVNSVSLLGAELVGRAYGGGLLKLEPREADRIPLPSPALLANASADLRAIRADVSSHLRGRRLAEAVRLVDEVLLSRHAGVTDRQLRALTAARDVLYSRRVARSRGKRGAD